MKTLIAIIFLCFMLFTCTSLTDQNTTYDDMMLFYQHGYVMGAANMLENKVYSVKQWKIDSIEAGKHINQEYNAN